MRSWRAAHVLHPRLTKRLLPVPAVPTEDSEYVTYVNLITFAMHPRCL